MPIERVAITQDKLRVKLYKKYFEIWSKRESLYRQNKSLSFLVVLGQCSEAMKAKLEAESSFEAVSNNSNVIKLLKLIRNIYFAYKSKRYPYLAVYTAIKAIYGNFQRNYTCSDS